MRVPLALLVFTLGCTATPPPEGPLPGDVIRDGASFGDASGGDGGEEGEGGAQPTDAAEPQDVSVVHDAEHG
jgi:hypothetical protein